MTAIEELIHELEETIRIHGDDSLNGLLAIERARELLTKEKEQREELIKEVCYKSFMQGMEIGNRQSLHIGFADRFYNEVIKPKYKL